MATKKMRHMVSLKKKRFEEDGFDLDLTYITPRIIAFGFPSEGREAMYRNPMEEVQRFFETRHKDHYWIYNLCAEPERQYKAKKFQNRVSNFPFYDHNAPPLSMIPDFCRHAENWLMEDVDNIIGIHCKAGKGRTGVMICCLLLYLEKYPTPEEALSFYGKARTYNGAGVTIPSQRRYIGYYFRSLKDGLQPDRLIFIKNMKLIDSGDAWEKSALFFTVECNGIETYNSKDKKLKFTKEGNELVMPDAAIPVCGNVKVIFYKDKKTKENRMCWYWVHTGYVTEAYFDMEKKVIDKAVGDKEHKVFPETFHIQVEFTTDGNVWDESLQADIEGTSLIPEEGASESKPDVAESDSEDEDESEEHEQVNGVSEKARSASTSGKSRSASTSSVKGKKTGKSKHEKERKMSKSKENVKDVKEKGKKAKKDGKNGDQKEDREKSSKKEKSEMKAGEKENEEEGDKRKSKGKEDKKEESEEKEKDESEDKEKEKKSKEKKERKAKKEKESGKKDGAKKDSKTEKDAEKEEEKEVSKSKEKKSKKKKEKNPGSGSDGSD